MTALEFEIKYLGDCKELEKLSKFLQKEALYIAFSRDYEFTTTYYDHENVLKDKGFTLRSREDSPHYAASVELKQLNGAERIELTQRDGSFVRSYFNLMAREDYPKQLAKIDPSELKEVFKIDTHRKEIACVLYGFKAEICLDKIKHSNGIEENELEIEFKNINSHQFKKLTKQITDLIGKVFPSLEYTELSKAQRSYNLLKSP